MATNIELNAGAGGAKLASYKDAAGNAWAPAVLTYVTDTTDNAAVVQPVQVGHGLPVQQDGSWTVTPSDTPNTVPWLASINQGGHTAVVTAGGALTVTGDLNVGSIADITNPVTVEQATAANLKATVSIAAAQTLAAVTTVGSITNPVAVTQSGAWSVGATQSGSWTVGLSAAQTLANVTTVGTITNPVTVAQATAANLKATVNIASGQTLDNVTTVGTITNPVAATQSGSWAVGAIQTGLWNINTVATLTGVTNPVTVAQSSAANLLATVNIASAQTLATVTTVGTITNPVGIAAGTNLVGRVSASNETNTIYNGATALTPKFAVISASSSGDNSIVALVSGKKIRVLRWSITANGAVNAKWRSNTTDITGLRYLTQYASGGGGFCPVGLFETAAGQALNLNLSGAVAVGGELTYVEV